MHDENSHRHLFSEIYVQRRVEEYREVMKSNVVVAHGDKFVVMVGWKPLEENWVKLNTNEAYFEGRTSSRRGIIRDMYGDCNGGFSKHIVEWNYLREEL